jgi:hypothetical protein
MQTVDHPPGVAGGKARHRRAATQVAALQI